MHNSSVKLRAGISRPALFPPPAGLCHPRPVGCRKMKKETRIPAGCGVSHVSLMQTMTICCHRDLDRWCATTMRSTPIRLSQHRPFLWMVLLIQALCMMASLSRQLLRWPHSRITATPSLHFQTVYAVRSLSLENKKSHNLDAICAQNHD